MIDPEKHKAYWQESAGQDFEAALTLIERDHLRHGLFFLHLAAEKSLKALIAIRKHEVPPYSHNLLLLAQKADLDLDEERE